VGAKTPRTSGTKYFFPPSTCKDNLVFMRFPLRLAYLAATCRNVFVDIFSPATKPDHRDSFRLFPAMMVFRHAIELLLKAIILDVCGKQPPTDTHNLSDLFEDHVRPNASSRAVLAADEEFVSEALMELQNADPGDAFRFGFDTKGKAYFPNMPESVDAPKLFGICERLWNILWRVHGPIS
jgi:hypothetical protein